MRAPRAVLGPVKRGVRDRPPRAVKLIDLGSGGAVKSAGAANELRSTTP